MLDLACGRGRHVRLLLARGHSVVAVDRDREALAAQSRSPRLEIVEADLESGSPWPLGERLFAGIVVTNYLYRPLFPAILGALEPTGILIYETFAAGNETVGKPSRADFLLQPGELLQACGALRVVAYEDGFLDHPPRFVQRIAAVRPAPGDAPARHLLTPS